MTDDAKGERLTDAQIVAIRDEHLPSQGEPFDCIAFARAIEAALAPAQAQRVEPELGRCCYGGMRTREACASCAAWRPRTESAASAAPWTEPPPIVPPPIVSDEIADISLACTPTASAEDAPTRKALEQTIAQLAEGSTSYFVADVRLMHNNAARALELIDRLTAANAALQARVEAAERAMTAGKVMRDEAVKILGEQLEPDRLSDHDALSQLHYVFDGPMQRQFDAAYDAAMGADK